MLSTTFNGCSRSALTVTPKNWNTKRATASEPWRITYRFYDPAFKDTPKWGHQSQLRGMNEWSTVEDRQKATKHLLAEELDRLDKQGWNPITRQYMAPADEILEYEIRPDTLFIQALEAARNRVVAVHQVKLDIKSVIKGVAEAAGQLVETKFRVRYDELPICEIRTKHIKYILDRCEKNNPNWSNSRYNKYKAYLSMLFRELLTIEAIDGNPARDIPTRKKTKKVRAILTIEEQLKIDAHLKSKCYNFWRYMQIFYRSGSRTTEMLSLRKNNKINLKKQEFIVLIKKGKEYTESVRPIPADVLTLWQEVWDQAAAGDYLFSVNLAPGPTTIRPEQIGRRWARHVKAPVDRGGLNIDKDFYSLKHLHTDNVAAMFDIETAQAATGHTTAGMAMVYAVGEKQRKLDKLKKTVVGFGHAN
ncbi:tyrosine-type recombinase/integrase [Paraflavitalea sp. CAU 1676]|uniref:tyrosine-type recombinase/integrase n=1 Tax=Paraflavitalea sp. CAU 1676 TaxID=3032598 RepID=UPI0023DCA030|nr:tyrosine-type recombinase/integrase [Paraflavitalea sp. CAU 1676]MDF2189334.1 tyrosine-type recombinase/integrase [Paraflavitalea sp. CAU 1676]